MTDDPEHARKNAETVAKLAESVRKSWRCPNCGRRNSTSHPRAEHCGGCDYVRKRSR